MPKTKFSPTENGFQFANYFVNQIADVPGIGKVQTAGRCGGMSYCALDHYAAGQRLPGFKPSDFGDKGVPPDGHPLADYIYQRQLDSFFTLSAIKFVTWSLAPDADNFLMRGVTCRTKKEEFPKLREAIDRGMPVPLGLIVARDLGGLGRNHQVVAYGYDYDEATKKMTVYIYDVNWPGQEITLTSGANDAGWFENSPGKEQWRGWFVQDYAPRRPPPDLARPLVEAVEKTIEAVGELIKGKPNRLTVTLKKLTFHNPEEPSAEADLALEFTVGDRVVRWPARGYRKVKHGTKVRLDRVIEVTVAGEAELVISGRIARDVIVTDAEGFDAFDYFNLDRNVSPGTFSQRLTRADGWGKGQHIVRSEGEPGGYTLVFTVE